MAQPCICLKSSKNYDKIKILQCLHIFHKTEIAKWIKNNDRICPICNIPINQVIAKTFLNKFVFTKNNLCSK